MSCAYKRGTVWIKLLIERVIKRVITEGDEGVLQFSLIDRSRVVRVKSPEAALPISHVLPQRSELGKVNRAGMVAVKHS